jgi:hypothetical protein
VIHGLFAENGYKQFKGENTEFIFQNYSISFSDEFGRHYFEYVRKDHDTADSLQQIGLKLIRQGEKEGVFKDYLLPGK